jgi:arabinofuranosyltransferase
MKIKDRLLETANRMKERFKKLPEKNRAFFRSLKERLKSVRMGDVKTVLQSFPARIKPFILETPGDLKAWHFSGKAALVRAVLLVFLLCLCFGAASSLFYFQANDAFVSFRYVSNAVKGWGYVWNPPPFLPVDGYTSFSWLLLLHFFWSVFGLLPPESADILSFIFSMGVVGLCFAFIRRMDMPETVGGKSLWIFAAVCFILLTNRTFLAFMSSGTEAAFFNFLAVWWAYEATSDTRNPLWMSCAALLLALTRLEGFVFVPATAFLLLMFMFQKRGILKCLAAFVPLAALKYYFDWRAAYYGEVQQNLYLMLFDDFFPSFGWDYLCSFIVEYGLYFWGFILIVWMLFKCLMKRTKDLIRPALVFLTFAAYAGYYVVFTGGDILEFRPFGMFIPLCVLGGIRMITQNISRRFRFLAGALILYLACALPIPWTHYVLTRDLTTRKQTTFLYRPVGDTIGFLGYPVRYWDRAQKNLIYQGVGLRHQEHRVMTEELLASFPPREVGERIKTAHRRLFAWDFAGVAGWVLPETYILDTSGQNDWIIARTYLRNPQRRLMGHDRTVPPGYITCFNGGTNLRITPFDRTQDATFLPSAYLKDSDIKGCEAFWRSQAHIRHYKEIELRDRTRSKQKK